MGKRISGHHRLATSQENVQPIVTIDLTRRPKPADATPDTVPLLSKKGSILSNHSTFKQSECSVCGTRNNFKMDFIQPGSVCLHQDKIVDLPVSNSKGRNHGSTFTVCKCKNPAQSVSKASQSLIKESCYISVLSYNKRSASQAQSIVESEQSSVRIPKP